MGIIRIEIWIVCILFLMAQAIHITSCDTPVTYDFKVVKDGISVEVYDFTHFSPRLHAKEGEIHIINFWATWCKPCVEELPVFEQFYQEMKDKNIRFTFVSLDFEEKIETKLIPFLQKNKLNGEVIVLKQDGMNDWINRVEPSWSGALPATILMHGDRKIFHSGSIDISGLKQLFTQIQTTTL